MKIIILAFVGFVSIANAQAPKTIHGCDTNGIYRNSNERKLNVLKNRYSAPKPNEINRKISLDSILRLRKDQTRWINNEGATIEGVLIDIENEGDESCNCYNPNLHDTHLSIGKKKGVPKTSSMVCEITPRWQKALRSVLDSLRVGDSVSITGWRCGIQITRRNQGTREKITIMSCEKRRGKYILVTDIKILN